MPLRLSRRSKVLSAHHVPHLAQAIEKAVFGRKVKVPRANAADGLVTQIKQLGWREPIREHRFHHVRMWRFDLAWPDYHLAVEVDGGGFVGGRHGRGMGIEKDCEKLAYAVIDGWRVMRVTPTQIRKGLAIQWVGQMLVDWGVR